MGKLLWGKLKEELPGKTVGVAVHRLKQGADLHAIDQGQIRIQDYLLLPERQNSSVYVKGRKNGTGLRRKTLLFTFKSAFGP